MSGASPTSAELFAMALKKRGDDLLSLGFRMQAPAWPRQGERAVELARTDVATGLERFDEQGWLESPEQFHRTPPRPRDVRLRDRRSAWLAYQHLEFRSGYRPHRGDPGAGLYAKYKANENVHTWLLRASDMSRPWVVCLHGYGMGSAAIDLFAFGAARLRSELDLNVACMVLPFHGPRAVGNGGSSELIRTGVSNMLHCHAQAAWDARRLIGWLRGQGAQDIGLHGVSLGGNVAALVAALEPELASVLVGVPATDFTFSYRQAQRREGEADSTIPESSDPIWGDLETIYRVISPLALEARMARERLAIYAGEVDGVVPASGVRALWRHWDRPRIGWYPGGHLGFLIESKAQSMVDQRMRALAADGSTAR